MTIYNFVKKRIPPSVMPLVRELKYWIYGRNEYKEADFNVRLLADDWRRLTIKSPIATRSSKDKRILFVTGYGLGSHYQALEPVIMNSLLGSGVQLFSLYCGGSLPACEYNRVGNNSPSALLEDLRGITNWTNCKQCRRCTQNYEKVYSNFEVEKSKYSDYLIEEYYEEAAKNSEIVSFENVRDWELDGVFLGEEVFATVLRATFMGSIPDTPYHRLLVKRYVYSATLMFRAATAAYFSIKPDRVVLIHGIYLTHGIAAKAARAMGVPVIVIGSGGIRKDTAILCHDETYHHQLIDESNDIWLNTVVSRVQEARILSYAHGKRNLGASQDYLSYHPNPIEDVESLRSILDISEKDIVVSIYTNVIWDAQILYASNAFDDIFEWMFFTIEEVAKNKEIIAVIRIHPAEKKGGNPTNQPMLPEIMRRFPLLPDNIRIVPPESDLSSYTLAEISSHCVIYGTKMGLELALMKKPVVICGETFSRNKGYGLDIVSKEQYRNFLEDPAIYCPDVIEVYEIALKYADYFYFRRMLDLPVTTTPGAAGLSPKLAFSSIEELNRNENLHVIRDGILELKKFVKD